MHAALLTRLSPLYRKWMRPRRGHCDPGLGDLDHRLYRLVLGARPRRDCSRRHDPVPAAALGAGSGLFPPGGAAKPHPHRRHGPDPHRCGGGALPAAHCALGTAAVRPTIALGSGTEVAAEGVAEASSKSPAVVDFGQRDRQGELCSKDRDSGRFLHSILLAAGPRNRHCRAMSCCTGILVSSPATRLELMASVGRWPPWSAPKP